MARARIFRITKAQAQGYEILDPPSVRRSARSNPGVTAIMGITNGRGAAARAARKRRAALRPKVGKVRTRPTTMRYRKKFALANANQGANPMFVVPNAARKRKARKAKSRKVSPASAFFLYPTTKGKVGAKATANRKRKARKTRKGTRKLKFGSPAWQKKYNPARATKKTRKAPKRRAKTAARRTRRLTATGVRRVTARRGKGKRRSGLSVALRNSTSRKYSAAWHRKMTHAVANRFKRARPNDSESEGLWEVSPGGSDYDVQSPLPSAKQEAAEKRAAAAAAAEGIAQDMFKNQGDFNAWFANAWKSKTFRKYYNAHKRMVSSARPKRGSKTMATRKKGKRTAARKPRKGKKSRKARKGTRKLKFGSAAWRKKYARKIAAGRRKAKKSTRKAAKRRKSGSRSKRRVTRRRSAARRTGGRRLKFGSKAYNKKYAAKRKRGLRAAKRHGRRHARRNFSFRAIPNMLIAQVKSMAVPGLVALGGYAVHRLATQLATRVIPASVGSIATPLSGLAAFAAGVWAVNKFLPSKAMAATLGMAVSFGALLLKSFLPSVAGYLGMGAVGFKNQGVRYGMQGPQFLQAAAGPQFLQAAAGPQFLQAAADYYQPASGIGEYVSDGSLSPVSDFGEYVASNLDVNGWGDYEVSTQYQTGADGYGAINDGVSPVGNLDQQFNIMEAAAGLGMSQPGSSSIYMPHEGMRNVGSQESNANAGVFETGGGNGILG